MTLRLRSRKAPEQTWLYAGNSVDPAILPPMAGVKMRGCGQSAGKAGPMDRNPQRLHARLRRMRRMMIQSTPHGDMGTTVNKVSVGEPADGSPPKESKGGSAELPQREQMKQVCQRREERLAMRRASTEFFFVTDLWDACSEAILADGSR